METYTMESNPLSKALAVANFLVLGFGALTGWPQISQYLHIGPAPVDCVSVFEDSTDSMTTPIPGGSLWNCFSKSLQKDEFNGNGWNSDADMQKWYNDLEAQGIMMRAVRYSGSPEYSCSTDPISGNTVCDEQVLEHINVYLYVPGDWQTLPQWVLSSRDSFSVTLHINDQGLISNLL